MAYTMKMGAFAKLENSTAQPTTTTWAEYSITFKEGSDLSNPIVILSADFATLAGYNYATLFGRYYWVMDVRALKSGLCEVSLKVDVLATYKTEIGSSSLYVLRSSASADGTIKDEFYPMKASATCYHQEQTVTYTPGGYSTGRIVLSIAGVDTAGGTTLIQFTPGEFKRLITALYTEINGFQLDDVVNNVVQYFGGNPLELINSAMWFPWSFTTALAGNVNIGSWTAALPGPDYITGAIITDPVATIAQQSYVLNKHPLAATRGQYLNLDPYTTYTLGIPSCGVVNLDNSMLLGETQIDIEYRMDAYSGQLIVIVTAPNSDQRLAYLTGQIGIPMNLRASSKGSNIISGAVSTLSQAAVAIATGGISAIAGAAAAGIGTSITARNGVGTSSSVGNGSASIMNQPGWLDTVCFDIADADNAQEGRPYCKIATPSGLGGFMRVADGYVDIAGPLPEQREIKRFLEGGFFYV